MAVNINVLIYEAEVQLYSQKRVTEFSDVRHEIKKIQSWTGFALSRYHTRKHQINIGEPGIQNTFSKTEHHEQRPPHPNEYSVYCHISR